jgi:hypothetical protein
MFKNKKQALLKVPINNVLKSGLKRFYAHTYSQLQEYPPRHCDFGEISGSFIYVSRGLFTWYIVLGTWYRKPFLTAFPHTRIYARFSIVHPS